MKRVRAGLLGAALLAAPMATLAATPAQAAPPAPPFNQCPPVGADTSCAILLVINPDGTVTAVSDPSQGPFDGSEDTLIGVQNNSSTSVPSLHLAGAPNPEAPFGFDGDGLCAGYTPAPAGCPFGPTGYEGPNTSFSGIAADALSGDVNFTGGLAPGASAYFSLESAIDATTLVVGPSSQVTVSCKRFTPRAGPYLNCRIIDPAGIRRERVVDLTTRVQETVVAFPCQPGRLTTTDAKRINDDGHVHRLVVTDCGTGAKHIFTIAPDGTVTPVP